MIVIGVDVHKQSVTAVAVDDAGRMLDERTVPVGSATSTQSVKRALNAGGFALLSELAVETERRAGTLATLTVRGLEFARDLRAIPNPHRRLPAASQRFWDWLQQRSETTGRRNSKGQIQITARRVDDVLLVGAGSARTC
jgi:DNA-binding transcriptional LysR family regulator